MKHVLVVMAILSLMGCQPQDDISTGKAFLKAFPSDKILMIQTPELQGTDAWVPFVFGGAKPAVTQNGVYENDVGLVEVDCDAIRLLDPTEDDVGNWNLQEDKE